MLIPIQSRDGSVIRYMEEDDILRNQSHFELVRNRRGHLKRVILKERNMPVVRLERTGTSFEQELPTGRLWALRGVEGSC